MWTYTEDNKHIKTQIQLYKLLMIEIDTLSTRFKEQDENEEMKSTS